MKLYKKLLKQYSILFIFPILDVFSTILFTNKYGIEAESNFIGKYLMYNLGSFSFVVMGVLSILSLFSIFNLNYFVFSKVCHKYFNKENLDLESLRIILFFVLFGAITGVYTMVLFLNFGSLW